MTLPPTFTFCSQIDIQDAREETDWASIFLQDNCYLCVSCSRLEGRVAVCIMQQAGDEPSQEGGWAQTRQSMTCLGDDALFDTDTQTRSLPAEFLQLGTSEKSNGFPPGEISPTLTCASAAYALVSSDTHLNHSSSSRKTPHFLHSTILATLGWLVWLVSNLKSQCWSRFCPARLQMLKLFLLTRCM